MIGFSDHSQTDIASIGAVAMGAKVLEKHFTLNKDFKGPDHSSSLNSDELTQWVKNIKEIEDSMGTENKFVTDVEKNNDSMRKYLVIESLKLGTIIKENMLKTMRTGSGILPIQNNLDKIIGKKLKIDVSETIPLSWDMIRRNL